MWVARLMISWQSTRSKTPPARQTSSGGQPPRGNVPWTRALTMAWDDGREILEVVGALDGRSKEAAERGDDRGERAEAEPVQLVRRGKERLTGARQTQPTESSPSVNKLVGSTWMGSKVMDVLSSESQEGSSYFLGWKTGGMAQFTESTLVVRSCVAGDHRGYAARGRSCARAWAVGATAVGRKGGDLARADQEREQMDQQEREQEGEDDS